MVLVLVLSAVWSLPVAGQVIGSVEVVSDRPQPDQHLAEVLGLVTGGTLDHRRLREGILALYAGGEVEYVRVEIDDDQEPAPVRVRVSYRARLTAIEVVGPSLRWRSRVRRWLELERHAPVTADQIEIAVRRVLRELRSLGYTAATVEPELDYHRADNTVSFRIMVALGPPQVIRAAVVEGLPPGEKPPKVLNELKLGKKLSERMVERIRRRVEAELRKRGYWEAEVTGTERQDEQARVVLLIKVDTGEPYQLEVSGPPGSEELIRKALPDPVAEGLHPAQTEALEERIREELQREGYLLASVSVGLSTEAPVHTLRVEVKPERPRQVTEVIFSGVHSLDHDQLAAVVSVRAGKTWGWRGREVTDTTLERDRWTLGDIYQRHGYAEVEVAPAVIEADGADGARIVFTIDEGRRWLITELRFEGFPIETAAAMESQEPTLLLVGHAWDQRQLEPERRRLELVLAEAGYPEGRVQIEADTSVAGEARIAVRAEPGPYVRIAEVVIAGLRTVQEDIVRKALKHAGVVSGAPYTLHVMLEAQRRLYELGLFRQVELVPIPGHEHRAERGLVVRCEEGRHRSYLLGAGWDTSDKTRITLGWSHLNLFGGSHALSAEARVSSREQRYQLSLRETYLPWLGEPGALVAYRTEEDFATYSQRRRGTWIEVGERRRQPFRRWLRFEYQLVRPDAPDDVLSDLERRDQEIRLASLTPNLEWDTRDDLLRPTRGALLTLSLEYAFPFLGTDAEFLKLQTGFSLYSRRLGGITAFGIHIGAIHPLGEANSDDPPNLRVPLNVRFFSGGRASHRAFKTDQLGIPGQTLDADGDAIGGNALLLLNFEYQRKIGGPVAGVVFVDVGNVWAEPAAFAWDDLRWGAGLGIRFDTPAGPLRLEYGVKLDQQEDEKTGELYLSFGVPF